MHKNLVIVRNFEVLNNNILVIHFKIEILIKIFCYAGGHDLSNKRDTTSLEDLHLIIENISDIQPQLDFVKLLFLKYGEGDYLTFEGFEHLLSSIKLYVNLTRDKHTLASHFVNETFQELHKSHDHHSSEISHSSHHDDDGGSDHKHNHLHRRDLEDEQEVNYVPKVNKTVYKFVQLFIFNMIILHKFMMLTIMLCMNLNVNIYGFYLKINYSPVIYLI